MRIPLIVLGLLTVSATAGDASAQYTDLYTFFGNSANDHFGRAVGDAGDVNGDGFADVIVGADLDDPGGVTSSGSARVLSGQDGSVFESLADAEGSSRFPARLAARLFESDRAINHVFVGSNQIVARRSGGWHSTQVDAASTVIADFFLYYPETG